MRSGLEVRNDSFVKRLVYESLIHQTRPYTGPLAIAVL